MKVITQFKFQGVVNLADGSQRPYEKMILIVSENGNYPKLINLPADTPDLRGKDIEVLYREYWSNGKKQYKASGYNIIQPNK